MMQIRKKNLYLILICCVLVYLLWATDNVCAELRNIKVGDKMPAFTLVDLNGSAFSYRHDPNKVHVIAFLKHHQQHSEKVIDDINHVFSQLRYQGLQISFIAIVVSGQEKDYWQDVFGNRLKMPFTLLFDSEYELWGKLGVTVAPTVMVINNEGIIAWEKAGHAYDFAPMLHKQLLMVAEPGETEQLRQADLVETVSNDTPQDRGLRHYKMGVMLAKKGRLEAAVTELNRAVALVPDSIEIRLELCTQLCRMGEGKTVLEHLKSIDAEKRKDIAAVKLLLGWANSVLGNDTLAESVLLEALEINPNSPRALFELGKIYAKKKEFEKASEVYSRALVQILDD